MLSVLFAFASAFTSALNVVTQHVASTAAPARDRGFRLALYLVRSPLWLFGVAAIGASFLLQAFALYEGRISVVQSVLVTELVFSLVIGRVWLRRAVSSAAWVSASVTSAGLAVFLVMSEPKGGHPQVTAQAWLPALLTCGGVVGAMAVLARRGSPVKRGALYASASGVTAAVMATLLKSASDALGHSGLAGHARTGCPLRDDRGCDRASSPDPGRSALWAVGCFPTANGHRQPVREHYPRHLAIRRTFPGWSLESRRRSGWVRDDAGGSGVPGQDGTLFGRSTRRGNTG